MYVASCCIELEPVATTGPCDTGLNLGLLCGLLEALEVGESTKMEEEHCDIWTVIHF